MWRPALTAFEQGAVFTARVGGLMGRARHRRAMQEPCRHGDRPDPRTLPPLLFFARGPVRHPSDEKAAENVVMRPPPFRGFAEQSCKRPFAHQRALKRHLDQGLQQVLSACSAAWCRVESGRHGVGGRFAPEKARGFRRLLPCHCAACRRLPPRPVPCCRNTVRFPAAGAASVQCPPCAAPFSICCS